jgi:hypothetical protein
LAFMRFANKRITLLTIGLLAASWGEIMFNFVAAGRSAIAYWVLLFGLLTPFFLKPAALMGRKNHWYFVAAVLVTSLGVGYSFYVAHARRISDVGAFALWDSNNPLVLTAGTIVRYCGDSIANFSEFWEMDWESQWIYYGGRQFPLYFNLLLRAGLIRDYSFEGVIEDIMNRYFDQNSFGAVFCSYLREMVMDFGVLGTFMLCLGFALLSRWALRRYARTLAVNDYLLVTFLGAQLMFGVFFSGISSLSGNGSILVLAAAYFFLIPNKPRRSSGNGRVALDKANLSS